MALTEPQRQAQRRLVATIRTCGRLNSAGLVMWREANAGEWKASGQEVGGWLKTLDIPYIATITGRVQPPWRSAATKLPAQRWIKLWIARDDLPKLQRWMPSLAKWLAVLADAEAAGQDLGPEGGGGDVIEMRRTSAGEISFWYQGERVLDQ